MASANWVCRLSLCALICASVSIARAQPEENAVVTTVDPCVPIELPRFRRLLSVELGTSIDYQPEAPREPGRTWVHVSCSPVGIELRLEDGVTRKSMLRILDPQPIESADRTRLLALAVAEFVVASWVELRVTPRPAVPPLGPPPPPAAETAARRSVSKRLEETATPLRWQLALGAGIQTYTSHGGLLTDFALRAGLTPFSPLTFLIGVDLGLMRVPVETEAEVEVGHIDTLHTTALAALLFGGTVGVVTLGAGPGVRFGMVQMFGTSQLLELRALSGLTPLAGVLVLGDIGVQLAPVFRLDLELEGGAVTLPARATLRDSEGEPLLQFSGGWFAAGLRAALIL
ncbi:MAG TPA: hypothetical protein VJR89_41820 [Polyangiales bacterium]|nr:hypothetical protein [Polyangiales bacterium]